MHKHAPSASADVDMVDSLEKERQHMQDAANAYAERQQEQASHHAHTS